jgi:hypothetical protein
MKDTPCIAEDNAVYQAPYGEPVLEIKEHIVVVAEAPGYKSPQGRGNIERREPVEGTSPSDDWKLQLV